jgi:hypothetical protein
MFVIVYIPRTELLMVPVRLACCSVGETLAGNCVHVLFSSTVCACMGFRTYLYNLSRRTSIVGMFAGRQLVAGLTRATRRSLGHRFPI